MAKHILKCTSCGKYTMKEICNECGSKTLAPRPPKYSPEDKYGKYRRMAKEQREGPPKAGEEVN